MDPVRSSERYRDLIVTSNYFQNILSTNRYLFEFTRAQLSKPVDKGEWAQTPITVNAYYNPLLNEIAFPAGILRFAFFDADAPSYLNYGALGMVIGHELTHAFDDQG
jgi:putative endopeptidase